MHINKIAIKNAECNTHFQTLVDNYRSGQFPPNQTIPSPRPDWAVDGRWGDT